MVNSIVQHRILAMEIAQDTEIRRLASGQICQLVQILEQNNDWKKLMNEIRKDCFNLEDHERKYNMHDMSLIEKASDQYKRQCSEILLDEWSTSGSRRPTVQLLRQYLEKADLKRGTKYVAEKLLGEPVAVEPWPCLLEPTDVIDPRFPFTYADPDSVSNMLSSNLNFSIHIKDTVPVGNGSSIIARKLKYSYADVTKIPYHVLEQITNEFHEGLKVGSGAFGSVYKSKVNGLDLAVKRLSKNETEHFEQEVIVLLTGVTHKNLLPPLAISDDHGLCLVYKFMPNGSLEDRLAMKDSKLPPLTWRKRVSIAMDISEGLKCLHEQPKPIVHRDIKSSNILLDENDDAKIGDFGLVRIKNDPKTINTETVRGTDAYMAPEALHGVISLKMDVFSFGMILLELLTGLPILGPDGHLMYYLIDAMDSDVSIAPHLDKAAGQWDVSIASELNDLTWRCLNKELKDRPTAFQVHTALKKLYLIVN